MIKFSKKMKHLSKRFSSISKFKRREINCRLKLKKISKKYRNMR